MFAFSINLRFISWLINGSLPQSVCSGSALSFAVCVAALSIFILFLNYSTITYLPNRMYLRSTFNVVIMLASVLVFVLFLSCLTLAKYNRIQHPAALCLSFSSRLNFLARGVTGTQGLNCLLFPLIPSTFMLHLADVPPLTRGKLQSIRLTTSPNKKERETERKKEEKERKKITRYRKRKDKKR